MNQMRYKTLIISGLLLFGSALYAQSAHGLLQDGQRLYDKKSFARAESTYRKAQGNAAVYNAGNAAYKQAKYEDAATLFKSASATASKPAEKANALYNLGNAYLQKGDYEEAIDAYEKSLRLFPNAADAKKNLQIAKKKLQEQEEPPPPPQKTPPPPPPPRPKPKAVYLDQAHEGRQKEAAPPPLSAEAARQLLAKSVTQEEQKNALEYRELAPATKPSKVKKDW